MYNAEKSNFEHIAEQMRIRRQKQAAQEAKCRACIWKTQIAGNVIYCPFGRCVEERRQMYEDQIE